MKKISPLKYILAFLVFLMITGEAFPFTAEIEDISGRKYFPALSEAIDGAEKSIFMVMYIVNLDERNKESMVYKLCESLVEAKDRGVKIKVILDQNIGFSRARRTATAKTQKNKGKTQRKSAIAKDAKGGKKNTKKRYVEWRIEGKNEDAFRFFKNNGIEVYYDDMTTFTHSKTLVIDDEIVIVGSPNWSDSAFTRNNETAVLIKSKELAKSILNDLSQIVIDYKASGKAGEKEAPIPIDRIFMEDPDLAGRMLTDHSERVFDVYLLLLNEYGKSPVSYVEQKRPKDGNIQDSQARRLEVYGDNTSTRTSERNEADAELSTSAAVISFDYDTFAENLGINKKMSKNAYRRQLNKTLGKLKKRYNLIRFNPRWGKDADVTLLNPRDKEKFYKSPKGRFFLLPGEYFSYGWDKRLSFPAKYCYLINLYKASLSPDNPWWFGAQETLEKQFHLQRFAISKGMNELKKLNLVDMEYSSIEKGYENREPTRYKMLYPYSPEKQAGKWVKLKKLYGPRTPQPPFLLSQESMGAKRVVTASRVTQARQLARIVFKENDPKVVEDIIHLIDEYGEAKVKDAFDIVSKKSKDNPKRTFRYVVGTIRKLNNAKIEE